jgi:hypothetical protein
LDIHFHKITLNVHVVFVALLAMAPLPHFPQLGTTSLAAAVPTNLQWQTGTSAYLSEAVTCVCIMARAARVRRDLRARPSPVESQLACNTSLGVFSYVLVFDSTHEIAIHLPSAVCVCARSIANKTAVVQPSTDLTA